MHQCYLKPTPIRRIRRTQKTMRMPWVMKVIQLSLDTLQSVQLLLSNLLLANYQNALSVPSITPSNMNNLDEHLSRDQIASPPTPPAHSTTTEPLIKQEYFEIDGDDNAQVPIDDVKEEYEDEDEGEYMSDCDECEHCVDGICQLNQYNLVRTNDNADNDAETGVDNQIGLNQDEIEGEPNASVANDLMPDVIEGSNQSAHNANNLLLSLIKQSEQQIRSVEKSTKNVTKQNSQNSNSVQPVTELGHQSINTPSTSGLRSSNRKQIQPKVFYQSTREWNKRGNETESSKAAKIIKPRNDDEVQQEGEGDNEEVIDDLNQSSDNVCDLSLINESGHQIRSVRKSTKQITKQDQASTSGMRSSNRKRTQTKVFDQSTRERNKRQSETESSKTAKRIKHGKGDEVEQEDDDGNVVDNGKHGIVTLEVNCTEPGCKNILKSLELWKQHLVSIHGLVPYKQLKDNVRHNQHGQTEYPCTECEVVKMSQLSLHQHWKQYHQAGKFECSVCAFVTNFRGVVLNHHLKNHRSSKFQCTHQGCNQAFKFMKDFKRHQLSHSGETPFKCTWDNCETSFNQFANAIRHVRTQHFHLPRSIKEQKEQNIIDERDPKVYVQAIGD